GRVAAGKSVRLEARVLDQRGSPLADRPITWTSDDPTRASVTGNGSTATVTAREPGSVRILAASGGQEGVAELTVLPSPERPPPAADSARGSGGRELGRAEIREALNQYVQAIN